MGQRFKISPDIFYDIFPSQTEPMSPVQSWTEERRYAVVDEGKRAPHEAPATLQKYPSLLMDGIQESTRQGGRPGQYRMAVNPVSLTKLASHHMETIQIVRVKTLKLLQEVDSPFGAESWKRFCG